MLAGFVVGKQAVSPKQGLNENEDAQGLALRGMTDLALFGTRGTMIAATLQTADYMDCIQDVSMKFGVD